MFNGVYMVLFEQVCVPLARRFLWFVLAYLAHSQDVKAHSCL